MEEDLLSAEGSGTGGFKNKGSPVAGSKPSSRRFFSTFSHLVSTFSPSAVSSCLSASAWTSVYSNKDILRGKWNLYNDTNKINTNIVSNLFGRNIWLSIVPKNFHCYSENDIMFLGKITQLGKVDDSYQIPISSRINGSVVYCFEMDPEISENFYMKRWFKGS